MKLNHNPRINLTLTLTAIASLLGGTLLTAAEGEKRKGKRGGPRGAAIEKFDTDKDGKLSKEEREAAKAAMQARQKAANTDGDGEVSEAERLAAFKKRLADDQALSEKVLARFDMDENGELSDEELKKAAKAGRRGPGQRRRPGNADSEAGEKGPKGKNRRGKRGGRKAAE